MDFTLCVCQRVLVCVLSLMLLSWLQDILMIIRDLQVGVGGLLLSINMLICICTVDIVISTSCRIAIQKSSSDSSLNVSSFLLETLLTPPLLRGAAPHPHAERTAFVQVPELDKLLRHGVKPRVGQDVVVVMMADRLLVQVAGKRPEAVRCHFLAQPQGQADQEEPGGEAFGVHAAGLPELPHRAQELGVGKEHGEVGGGVRQGVMRP